MLATIIIIIIGALINTSVALLVKCLSNILVSNYLFLCPKMLLKEIKRPNNGPQ